MEDELKTLRLLFQHQTTVVGTMHDLYRSNDLAPYTRNGVAFLDEALARLKEYKGQADNMLERVDTTRNDYEKLLEMVQRQAQVDEVRWSRLQTELASTQNLSVMIFTTFTVIFLPLTFFTSVFGMNTQEWGHDDNLTLGQIGIIALPLSTAVILATLVAAFSGRVQSIVGRVYRSAKKGSEKVREKTRRGHRQEQERREWEVVEERARRRRQEQGFDFWRNMRRGTGGLSVHLIPEMNRKKR
jgi:hypothetical protein